jgi:hypothetical protein
MALLSAKPIVNWCDVNMYSFGNQWIVNSGDSLMLYFQIIDTNQAIASLNSSYPYGGYGFGSPFTGITGVGTTAGLRYLLGVQPCGASSNTNIPYSVQVTFPSIDSNQVITVNATQADPNDSSIWVVSIPANQAIGGGNVQFTVVQGNNISRFNVPNMIDVIFPNNVGSC